ncbi:MAG: hypothetical protein ACUVQP_04905 [Bacteroidales bacterium]
MTNAVEGTQKAVEPGAQAQAPNSSADKSVNTAPPNQNPDGVGDNEAVVNVDAFENDEIVNLGDGKLTWQELVEAGRERLKSLQAKQSVKDETQPNTEMNIDPKEQAILGLTKEVFEMKAEKAIEKYPNATVDEIRRRLLDLPPDKRDLRKIPDIAKEIHEDIEKRVAKRYEEYIKEKSELARKNLISGVPMPTGESNEKPITLDDTAEIKNRISMFLNKK